MTKQIFTAEDQAKFKEQQRNRFNEFIEDISKIYGSADKSSLAQNILYQELTLGSTATKNQLNLKNLIAAELKIYDDLASKAQNTDNPEAFTKAVYDDFSTQIKIVNERFALHFSQHTPEKQAQLIEKVITLKQAADKDMDKDASKMHKSQPQQKEDLKQQMQNIKNEIYILAQGKYNYADQEMHKDADASIKELLEGYNKIHQSIQDPNNKQDKALEKNSNAYKFLMSNSEDTIARMMNAKSYKEKGSNSFSEFNAESFLQNAPPEVGLKILNIQNKIDQRKDSSKVKLILKDTIDKFFNSLANAVYSNGVKDADLNNLKSAMLQESLKDNPVKSPAPEYRPLTVQPELNENIAELKTKLDKFINKPSSEPTKNMDYANGLKRPTPPVSKGNGRGK